MLGLLGNLGLGPFAGVPAVIAGHVASARARRWPLTHGGRGIAIAGFLLGYASLLLGPPVLALLLSVAVPPLLRHREGAVEQQCRTRLVALSEQLRRHADTHDHRLPDSPVALGTNSPGLPPFICPGSRPRPYRPTLLEWMATSQDTTGLGTQAVLRCPAHGHTVSLAGDIRPGRPGLRRRKSGD